MKLIILLFLALLNVNANSNSFNKIAMNANFYIFQGKNKTENLNFKYNMNLYHDVKEDFVSSSYCFFASKTELKFNSKDKSKYKICLKSNNKVFVYILNKNNRYSKSDDFKAIINDINLNIKKDKKSCHANANSYLTVQNRINRCLKHINKKS